MYVRPWDSVPQWNWKSNIVLIEKENIPCLQDKEKQKFDRYQCLIWEAKCLRPLQEVIVVPIIVWALVKVSTTVVENSAALNRSNTLADARKIGGVSIVH